MIFPWFLLKKLNSMIFPYLEFLLSFFKVFHDISSPWAPWPSLYQNQCWFFYWLDLKCVSNTPHDKMVQLSKIGKKILWCFSTLDYCCKVRLSSWKSQVHNVTVSVFSKYKILEHRLLMHCFLHSQTCFCWTRGAPAIKGSKMWMISEAAFNIFNTCDISMCQ